MSILKIIKNFLDETVQKTISTKKYIMNKSVDFGNKFICDVEEQVNTNLTNINWGYRTIVPDVPVRIKPIPVETARWSTEYERGLIMQVKEQCHTEILFFTSSESLFKKNSIMAKRYKHFVVMTYDEFCEWAFDEDWKDSISFNIGERVVKRGDDVGVEEGRMFSHKGKIIKLVLINGCIKRCVWKEFNNRITMYEFKNTIMVKNAQTLYEKGVA